jgi:hypothetical protein
MRGIVRADFQQCVADRPAIARRAQVEHQRPIGAQRGGPDRGVRIGRGRRRGDHRLARQRHRGPEAGERWPPGSNAVMIMIELCAALCERLLQSRLARLGLVGRKPGEIGVARGGEGRRPEAGVPGRIIVAAKRFVDDEVVGSVQAAALVGHDPRAVMLYGRNDDPPLVVEIAAGHAIPGVAGALPASRRDAAQIALEVSHRRAAGDDTDGLAQEVVDDPRGQAAGRGGYRGDVLRRSRSAGDDQQLNRARRDSDALLQPARRRLFAAYRGERLHFRGRQAVTYDRLGIAQQRRGRGDVEPFGHGRHRLEHRFRGGGPARPEAIDRIVHHGRSHLAHAAASHRIVEHAVGIRPAMAVGDAIMIVDDRRVAVFALEGASDDAPEGLWDGCAVEPRVRRHRPIDSGLLVIVERSKQASAAAIGVERDLRRQTLIPAISAGRGLQRGRRFFGQAGKQGRYRVRCRFYADRLYRHCRPPPACI